MKRILFLLSIIFTMGFACCGDSTTKIKDEFKSAIPDSIDLSKLIAAYKEDNGYTILLLKNQDPLQVKKITYRKDFPVFQAQSLVL